MSVTAPPEHEQSAGVEDMEFPDPIAVAVRLGPPRRDEAARHFSSTDPPRGLDLSARPRIGRVLKNRKLQFALILPNQLIFWLVIGLGLLGTVVPGLNFGTAITWYIWFCLVFVMMVTVGRAWCAMCPFGGFAEWVQRRTFWQRTQRTLGLGRKLPEPIARYGLLLSVGAFLLLTWIEEFFNIAGPGTPEATSFMVLGIVASALIFFLVFERRTFCRYACPLSALIGTVGAMGTAAGFRTRDREVCMSCQTKDCMRGGDEGYGCPWYTWPGSADSNLTCGLCTECYKSCPSDNIGFYVQPPLTSVVAPRRRRADVAWAVAILWGLVVFQQLNATHAYSTVDNWLNSAMHFPRYPNPIDYIGVIGVVALIFAGIAWIMSRTMMPSTSLPTTSDLDQRQRPSFIDTPSRFRSVFVPLAYGLIPVVGADYFARQLPKFFKHASRIVPSIGAWFGAGSTHSSLYNLRLLSNPGIVIVQVTVIGLGMLASLWATWKISGRDLALVSTRPLALRIASLGVVLLFAAAAGFLYVIMHAAS
ncbi:MAG: 4Fe-4S binding protein [Actinomycetota bacterium]|nr:4Fe-4S binding protein [Actinomycetota bacterium]